MLRVLKWTVPVDGREHEVGGGPVVKVACQNGPESVQVWTVERDEPNRLPMVTARVVATGEPFEVGRGTVEGSVALEPRPGYHLVWHLWRSYQ